MELNDHDQNEINKFIENISLFENNEASCLGAAIDAAVGAGIYASFEMAALEMTGIKNVIKPDIENNTEYKKHYEVYKKIYPSLKKRN